MSIYTINNGTIKAIRPTLHLPAGALALRALRPSFRSIHLPVRYVRQGVEGFKRDSTGYCIIPIFNDVPVFEKRSRLAH